MVVGGGWVWVVVWGGGVGGLSSAILNPTDVFYLFSLQPLFIAARTLITLASSLLCRLSVDEKSI